MVFSAVEAQATNLSLSPVPLYIGGTVEPNIMFTLDDSGSMYWSWMPENIILEYDTRRAKAADYNTLYYNPWVTYEPPVDAVGNSLGNATFNAAWNDGYHQQSTCTIDLGSEYQPSWYDGDNCDPYNYWWLQFDFNTGNINWIPELVGDPQPAYYYVYYTNHPDGPQPQPANCSNSLDDDDCYLKVVVGANSGPGGSDERTNFANWYSYYRRRIYAARAGIGRAFAQQGEGMRVGFAAINNGTTSIDGVNTAVITKGVRHFSGTDRSTFFDLLYNEEPSGGTPLRQAANLVGQYFQRDDDQGPWNDTPGQSGGVNRSCRQSYHILMTDGYWNGNDPQPAPGNADSDDGYPFKDNFDNTLADVARYYWENDLVSGLANQVPSSDADPADWQHLVTFTVGLGVSGNIDPATAFAAVGQSSVTDFPWPNPTQTDTAKIDDMLHAAVNSYGGFYSAQDPAAFADALDNILKTIVDLTSSASAVSLNSGSLYGGTHLFQARFNTSRWDGDIWAYQIQSDGSIASGTTWQAASQMPAADDRRILTYDGSNGVPFRWGTDANEYLTAAQKTALGSESLLNYLRGVRTEEQPNGSYRKRASTLGDIVSSAPLYVGPPSAGYPDFWGDGEPENANQYSAFVNDHATRTPMVLAGANDGMLHAFDANTGVELFAYVPSMLISDLPDLSDPAYTHRYYVDGTPVAMDAYFDSSWHTVVVGGLNGGGQGLYALDITDPPTDVDTETSLSGMVMWEFSDADDSDLGYTYSRPNVVRLANGGWGVILGNGYNNTVADGHQSTTGNAVLYVLDLTDGSIIKKIDTGVGSDDDPTGANRPNGLSTVAPVDIDGDYIVDYVYGGDLFGNLWKFDLTASNANSWDVALKQGNTPIPLFKAMADTSDATSAQPITVRPTVGHHPTGKGYLIYFGTGKYIEVGDNSTTGQTTQTFYAVWDQDTGNTSASSELDRSDLLQQEILAETTYGNYEYRLTSDNTPTWDNPDVSGIDSNTVVGWYMDLILGSDNQGERQVTDPILRSGRIIFTTLLPSDDPCSFGGTGWLMELDAKTGGRLGFTPFDTNSDGSFNSSDYVDFDTTGDGTNDTNAPTSGKKSKVGILPSPAILADKLNAKEHKYESGSTGEIERTVENPGASDYGRKSWIQLINE
ncbi:MAG: pilus assembly protein PilY [Gammaproteobacteria bacterium]|nr:MAG: pilus assembly protein PilY [Gammaproteobacteria bacterium]